MSIFINILCLFVVSFVLTSSIPISLSSQVEIHKFRWATSNDLNKTRCAFPTTPWRFPNDTLHSDPEWSTLHGCKY